MSKLFGSPISSDVVKQIETRESILSKGARSTQDLRFLNERSGWIRIISGANLLQEEGGYTSKDSEELILSGGAFKVEKDGNRTKLIKYTKTNFTSTERGRYSLTDDLGIRPEPGITSFRINHKGPYGAVREAQLEFNVWSREDLNTVQELYLRPGMSIIAEWGNSVYVDNQGDLQEMSLPLEFSKFFEYTKTSKIISIINGHREKTNYNYDGFIGLVTNFSWSYRSDGGYDCSIKVVSRGAIIESLTLLKPNPYYDPSDEDTSDKELQEREVQKRKSTFHALFQIVDDYLSSNSTFRTSWTLLNLKADPPYPIGNTINSLRKLLTDDEKRNFKGFSFKGTSSDKNQSYISLRSVLALLNVTVGVRSPNGERISSFNTSTEDYNKYRTFSTHFSLNPFICLLPKIPSGYEYVEEQTNKFLTFFTNIRITRSYNPSQTFSNDTPAPSVEVNNFPIQAKFKDNPLTQNIVNFVDGEKRKDDLLDIFVNSSTVVDTLDEFYNKLDDEPKINALDFVNSLLRRLQSALGNINSFSINYDEDTNTYVVIDREKVKEDTLESTTRQDIPILNLTGLKSTVSDISLETKITSELTSQIAITAQGSTSLNNDVNINFLDWNIGSTDRFKYKDSTTGRVDEDEDITKEERRKKWNDSVIEAYNLFNKQKIWGAPGTSKGDPELFAALVAEGSIYFKMDYLNENVKKFDNDAKQQFRELDQLGDSGIIPVSLSIRLDGISGVKIGQVFKVGSLDQPSQALPNKYDRYGFITTGVDHSIENSKWFTNIKGLTFKLI